MGCLLQIQLSGITNFDMYIFQVREVGNQATWSLSSCKPGYGVHQLRDGSLDTYWQVELDMILVYSVHQVFSPDA